MRFPVKVLEKISSRGSRQLHTPWRVLLGGDGAGFLIGRWLAPMNYGSLLKTIRNDLLKLNGNGKPSEPIRYGSRRSRHRYRFLRQKPGKPQLEHDASARFLLVSIRRGRPHDGDLLFSRGCDDRHKTNRYGRSSWTRHAAGKNRDNC